LGYGGGVAGSATESTLAGRQCRADGIRRLAIDRLARPHKKIAAGQREAVTFLAATCLGAVLATAGLVSATGAAGCCGRGRAANSSNT